MRLWSSEGRPIDPLPRAMARLARLPASLSWGWGIFGLLTIVAFDNAARPFGLRLVPVYVPFLCAIFWALGRWQTIAFAILAAVVALLPDVLASPAPFGFATIGNAVLRLGTYLFLAVIITGSRRAYDEADYRAMYDGLTGALNKMPFQAAVVRHLSAARRARHTMIAACVDLDGFKAINTHYGHAEGDAALRSFSQEAMHAVRGSDLVGRLGGDEFGFLLAASSEHVAEALTHALHQRLTHALGKTGLPLSCSMGALILRPGATLGEADLFHRADALMRKAKASGKSKALTEVIQG